MLGVLFLCNELQKSVRIMQPASNFPSGADNIHNTLLGLLTYFIGSLPMSHPIWSNTTNLMWEDSIPHLQGCKGCKDSLTCHREQSYKNKDKGKGSEQNWVWKHNFLSHISVIGFLFPQDPNLITDDPEINAKAREGRGEPKVCVKQLKARGLVITKWPQSYS